jgi:hypothetical protein
MEKLAQRILLDAFNDELEKIATRNRLEKWAAANVSDWDELSDLEKRAFIGKMVQSVGKFFGRGTPSGAQAVAKKARPLVEFGDKPLAGTAALRNQKHIGGVGDVTFR